MKKGSVIGSLELTFNIDLDYQYYSPEIAQCYSIRKRNWINLLKIREDIPNYRDFISKFKSKLLMDFMNKIYFRIKEFQEE